MSADPEITIQAVSMGQNLNFRIPLMTEVAPLLWVGGSAGSVAPGFIKNYVSLVGMGHYTFEHELDSALIVNWQDSLDQNLDQVDAMAEWINSCTGPTLVHCLAGLNRSCLVAARTMVLSGWDLDDAVKTIREKRHELCLFNPHFMEWLRNAES